MVLIYLNEFITTSYLAICQKENEKIFCFIVNCK